MKTDPKISVIIPVYNTGKYLRPCLDSVIGQTYRNLEIFLIDDGSTDGSGAVCDEYAANDPRIICIHQENGGVSRARNAGLERATGDYYSFPDSDDYLELDAYEYLLSLIRQHPCDAVNFEYFSTYADHEKPHRLALPAPQLCSTAETHRMVMSGEPFSWNKLFAARLVEGLRFREDIARGEDSLFAHQALDRAERVWFDSRPLYHYVQSEESACRGRFRVSQLTALKLPEAYRPLYLPRYPDLWQQMLGNMLHLCITLYYDMWADEADYTAQQREVFAAFRQFHAEKGLPLSGKERLKFGLFRLSPTLFCRIHKRAHHL